MADSTPPPPDAAGAGDEGPRFGLDELLTVAGQRLGEDLNARTVRLYATQGLIDRPGKDGRSAVYGQRHLLQLLLIRTLARRGLSLSAIAPLVAESDADLQQQLDQLEAGITPPLASDDTSEALAYLQSLEGEKSQSTILFARHRDGPDQGSRLDGSSSSPSLLQLLGTPFRSRPSARSSSRSSSVWHRFALAPGVELHLSDTAAIPPAGGRREAWLQRLLERLRDQLNAAD